MCQAFSCLVLPDTTVVWQFGMDSHEDLIKLANLKDDTVDPNKMTFCRTEISPKNSSYIKPDKWALKIDQEKPRWWTSEHAKAAEKAHGEWMKELNKILIKKPIVHPFRDIKPPKKITKKHFDLLKAWASVRASVRDSVEDSVEDSVWDSVGASVRANVGDGVWDSMWDSVGDNVRDSVWVSVGNSVKNSVWVSVGGSVGAYVGSFFNLPRSAWKYTEKIKIKGYPFQSAVDLWMMGLIPSFDGKTWRLHGGKKAKILWKGQIQHGAPSG